MFYVTYKNTIKTLFRSALFWMILFIVGAIVIEGGLQIQSGRAIVENNVIIRNVMDTEEEFREYFTHNFYVQTIQNSQSANLMSYAMPLLAVLTTMLVVIRDYRDNLYEIEKASGTKPMTYFGGRITALVTVNYILCFTLGLLAFHTYFYSRGGPPDFFASAFDYFADSTVRIFRVFICAEVFTVLFYIAITYVIACLSKSGFLAGIVGTSTVFLTYLAGTSLKSRFPELFHDYLRQRSLKHYIYVGLYDSGLFNNPANSFTMNDVIICIAITLGMSAVFLILSYISTKKRTL